MEIHTQRLILREFNPTDLEAVHEYASDPIVVRYMPFGPNTLEDSKNFLDRAITKQGKDPRTDLDIAIMLKSSNRLIGGCRLNKVSKIEGHIGYILNRKHWGNGYATEAAKALTRYGFNELDLHRVYATCDPENVASRRVLEKVGMTLEGRLRENVICHGEYRDSLLLAILRQEWEQT